MSDIVERLRSDEPYSEDLCLEAADEIATLRAEVKRLAKLRTIELEHSNRWLEERDTLRAEVERLKARDAEWLDVGTDAHGVITRMKAELTTLRAEVDKLRAALHIIAWEGYEDHDFQRIARAALGEENSDE